MHMDIELLGFQWSERSGGRQVKKKKNCKNMLIDANQ